MTPRRARDGAEGMVKILDVPPLGHRLFVRDFVSKVTPWCWLGDGDEPAIRYRAARLRAAIRYAIKRSRAASRGRGR